MSRRAPLAVLVLVLGSLSVLPAPAASAATVQQLQWCSQQVAAPCILELTNTPGAGPTLTYTEADSTTYFVDASMTTYGESAGQRLLRASIKGPLNGGTYEPIGIGSGRWSVKIRVGDFMAGSVRSASRDTGVVRDTSSPATRTVTLSGRPVVFTSGCTYNIFTFQWTCANLPPASPNGSEYPLLDFDVSDNLDPSYSAAERAGYDGFLFSTNAGNYTFPPDFATNKATGTLRITVHLGMFRTYRDATTPITYLGKSWIPWAMLRNRLGMDDPASLPESSISADVQGSTGGTYALAQNPGATRVELAWDGVRRSDATDARGGSFARAGTNGTGALVVRMTKVRPLAPGSIDARRLKPRRGKVVWGEAASRGFRVRGYDVTCVGVNRPKDVRKAAVGALARAKVFTGLVRGRAYDCRVRARSAIGPGPWATDRMPAR